MKSSFLFSVLLALGAFSFSHADSLYASRAELLAEGQTLYQSSCTGCHGFEGKGHAGGVPPLKNSDWFMAERLRPVSVVLHGLEDPIEVNGMQYFGGMPAFGEELSDFQIAAILTYIRAGLNDSSVTVCHPYDESDPETMDDDGFALCDKVARDPGEIASDSIGVWEVAAIRNPPAVTAPTGLAYADRTVVYIRGTAIDPNVPTVTGDVDLYTVTPALPAGLALDGVTGVISGTPVNVSAAAQFVVTAENIGGSATDTLRIAVASVPGAPGDVVAVAGDAQATVSWEAPASDSGMAIVSYAVIASPGGAACTTPDGGTTQCVVAGLTNGVVYRFAVTATNAAGTGTASAQSAPVTPAAPQMITFDPPGAQPFGSSPTLAATASSGLPVAFASLTPGVCEVVSGGTLNFITVGTCTIEASQGGNAAYHEATSVNRSFAVDAVAPGAPTEVSGVAGDAQVTVSWSAPAFNGGAAISGYTATASPGGAQCTTSGATSCAVTGLTNGTAYTFTVTAANAAGAGAASDPSGEVMPAPDATAPSAPTSVSGAPGNGQVTVSWSAPVTDGGSVITSYTVTAVPGGAQCATTDGIATQCVVTGLANGIPYTFVVVATNDVGNSVSSSASAPVTPRTVPGAPVAVTSAVSGVGELTVSWTPPAGDGGSAITSYTVTAHPGGAQCNTSDGVTTQCAVGGLGVGAGHRFTVVAFNAAGAGASSDTSELRPAAGLPHSAAEFTVSQITSGAVSFSWSAANANFSSVTGYAVTATPGGAQCTTSEATSCVVTGLSNGVSYTFALSASNAAGTGVVAGPIGPVAVSGPPGAPVNLVPTVSGNGRITLAWSAPASDSGSAILGYEFQATGGAAAECAADSVARSCEFTGLTGGATYTFQGRAFNERGYGAMSVEVKLMAVTSPSVPSNTTAAAGDGQATVSWTEPAGTGGSAITGYTVRAVEDTAKTCGWTNGPLTCVVAGLANGTAYTFTVRAVNAVGASPASSASSPVTPLGVPGVPTDVAAIAGDGQATVSWTAPAGTGGSAITGYTVRAVEDTAKTCGWTDGPLTCVVAGLMNGTAYTFTVAAVNGVGVGTMSAPSAPVVPATVPGVPTDVTAIAGDGQATVSWAAPAGTGGSAITGYTVRAVEDTAKTCTWTSGPLQCVVAELPSGTTYTFVVRARNAIGDGAFSVPSTPVATGLAARDLVFHVTGRERTYTFVLPPATAGARRLDVSIHDLYGRTVWSARADAGPVARDLTWNGRTGTGRIASAGLYIVRITVQGEGSVTHRARTGVRLR